MSIIAKFHLQSLTTTAITNGAVLKAGAVMRGDRNASWASASPSGNLETHLNEAEFQWVLAQRDQALAGFLKRQAAADKIKEETGKVVYSYGGVEFFLTFTREAPDAPIVRPIHLIEVSDPDGDKGKVIWSSNGSGPYTTIDMWIDNPPAYIDQRDAKAQGHEEWFLAITASTDGYAGDGHAFRQSAYREGVYGHDLCGECFGRPEDH